MWLKSNRMSTSCSPPPLQDPTEPSVDLYFPLCARLACLQICSDTRCCCSGWSCISCRRMWIFTLLHLHRQFVLARSWPPRGRETLWTTGQNDVFVQQKSLRQPGAPPEMLKRGAGSTTLEGGTKTNSQNRMSGVLFCGYFWFDKNNLAVKTQSDI